MKKITLILNPDTTADKANSIVDSLTLSGIDQAYAETVGNDQQLIIMVPEDMSDVQIWQICRLIGNLEMT